MTYDQIRTIFYNKTGTNSSQMDNTTLNTYTQPAEDRIVQLILQFDSTWQHDDSNRTTVPIGTQNIVSAQQDYSLPSTIVTLDRIELLPNGASSTNGWTRLAQIDQQMKKRDQSAALSSYQSVSGTPTEYDLVGNSVFLYPTPNYSQSNSLKFFYSRIPLKYDYTANSNGGQFSDGTGSGATSDTPGFNSLFHELIAWIASSTYAIEKRPDLIAAYMNKTASMEADLQRFYGQRNRDGKCGFSISTDSNE